MGFQRNLASPNRRSIETASEEDLQREKLNGEKNKCAKMSKKFIKIKTKNVKITHEQYGTVLNKTPALGQWSASSTASRFSAQGIYHYN